MVYLFVKICLLLLLNEGCSAQIQWNMHDTCGTVISNADLAGELHLDVKQLPANLPGDACKVTVTPANLDNQDSMVQFYFTSFKLYGFCKDVNVTVLDGDSNNDNVIKGLPRYLCDVNTTLEGSDQYFTSSGSSIKIIFNVNDAGRSYQGIFTMKFVSYHIGSCSGTDVHECSNGYCVPSAYSCLEDFNACGQSDSNCGAEPSADETVSSVVSSVVTVVFVTIFVVVTIGGFCMVWRHGRGMGGGGGCLDGICECLGKCGQCLGGCCQCTAELCSDCCRCTKQKCSNCCDSVNSAKDSCGERCTGWCQSLRASCEEQTNQETDGEPVSQTTQTSTDVTIVTSQPASSGRNASSDTVSTDSSSSEISSESDRGVTPSAPPVHLASGEAPPPSYEEAVAPSYKEYIANKDKYDRRHRHKKK